MTVVASISSPISGVTFRHRSQPDPTLHLFTDHHSYVFKSKMGQGADGEVWRALMDGKQDVAIKMIPIAKRSIALNECRALRALNHDGIVKLCGDGFVQARWDYFIVMEWIDGKTLEAYRKEIVFKTGHNPTEQIAEPLFSQMAAALKYVHDQHIAHLDLSLANFLIVGGKKIVLIDFGDGKLFPDEKALLSDVSRSYGQRPPETLARLNNRSAPLWSAYPADWWNLGVLTYGFLLDRHPFYTPDECQAREKTIPSDCKQPKEGLRSVRNELVLQGLATYLKLGPESLTFPEAVGSNTRAFIRKLLSIKPEERCPL